MALPSSSYATGTLSMSIGTAPAVSRPGTAIKRIDARDSKAEVVALFEGNGNTRFAQQFDWYYRDQGQELPASWVLRARNGTIRGLISVTVRTLRFGECQIRAGVAGNLIVDRAKGDYFAAFALVDAAKTLVKEKAIDVLLGIPNQLAEPIFSRRGFRTIDQWKTYAQVFSSGALLKACLGLRGRLASPIVDLASATFRALSKWKCAPDLEFSVIELSEDELLQLRPQDWQAPSAQFVVGASSDYLKWRFLRDPLSKQSIFGIVTPDQDLLGCLVLRRLPGRTVIVDCFIDHSRLSELAAILIVCRRDKQARDTSVWITPLRSTRLAADLGASGFLPVVPAMGGYPELRLMGYWLPDHPLADAFAQAPSWVLFPGFNDV